MVTVLTSKSLANLLCKWMSIRLSRIVSFCCCFRLDNDSRDKRGGDRVSTGPEVSRYTQFRRIYVIVRRVFFKEKLENRNDHKHCFRLNAHIHLIFVPVRLGNWVNMVWPHIVKKYRKLKLFIFIEISYIAWFRRFNRSSYTNSYAYIYILFA